MDISYRGVRRKISFLTSVEEEADEDYVCEENFEFFAVNPIPRTVPYHRSFYLHNLNVLIEDLLAGRRESERKTLERIYENCTDFIFTEKTRGELSDEHRVLIWVVRCRLALIVHYLELSEARKKEKRARKRRAENGHLSTTTRDTEDMETEEDNKEQFPLLESLNLIIPGNIFDYSVKGLWRALTILCTKFNKLHYSEELKRYLRCIFLSCSKFMVNVNQNARLFDHPLFIRRHKCGDSHVAASYISIFSVNAKFIEETERLFYGFQRSLKIYEMFTFHNPTSKSLRLSLETNSDSGGVNNNNNDPDTDDSAPQISVNGLRSKVTKPVWLKCLESIVQMTNGAFSDFIEKRLSTDMPEWNLYVSERERYKKENRYSDPSGYNIIAKYRPESLDKLVEVLNSRSGYKNKILEPGIEKIKKVLNASKRIGQALHFHDNILEAFKNESFQDFDRLCLIILSHVYDAQVSTQISLYKFVVFRDDLLSPLQCNESLRLAEHPYMVEYFSEWGVFNPTDGNLIRCSIFVECFLLWLILSCDKEYLDVYKSSLLQAARKHGLSQLYENLIGNFEKQNAAAAAALNDAKGGVNMSETTAPTPNLPRHYTQAHKNFIFS